MTCSQFVFCAAINLCYISIQYKIPCKNTLLSRAILARPKEKEIGRGTQCCSYFLKFCAWSDELKCQISNAMQNQVSVGTFSCCNFTFSWNIHECLSGTQWGGIWLFGKWAVYRDNDIESRVKRTSYTLSSLTEFGIPPGLETKVHRNWMGTGLKFTSLLLSLLRIPN